MPPQSLPLIKSEIQQCGCLSTSVVQFQSLREERRERAYGCQSSDLRQKGFRIPFQLIGLWFEITVAVAAELNFHTLLDIAMGDFFLVNLIKCANQCCIFFYALFVGISIRYWNYTHIRNLFQGNNYDSTMIDFDVFSVEENCFCLLKMFCR